jgi:hypothetical protein
MAAATADIKMGFWLGLGLFLALLAGGILQAMTLRAVKRG